MLINQINNYLYNTYPRRNTCYSAMPQMSFRGLKGDVVSIAKKFEDLPIKEQRRTLFETFNNSPHFSFETLRNLMKFKDKSIPLIKELYELTKNDGCFTDSLPFVDLNEEDLPARIEFYKKYKEVQTETIWDDVNVLGSINRYNLPLAKLIGIKGNYTEGESKLIQRVITKEDADAKTEAWKLLSKTLEDGEYAYGYDKQERIAMLNLTQRLDDLEETDRVKTRNLDLTIKMWDRIPQKDLFQGNYSTCCIGMGNSNGWSMPVYLLNTVFNMIELVDNNTGEIVGNALCYFVKSDDNKPVFIIDNIEIRNSVKPSDEVGKKLRSAITKYAKNISKDVTGRDDIQILLGTSYNDVPVGDLPKSYTKLSALGDFEDEVYIDAIGYETEFYTQNTLYKLT